jgi:branched-chain amino acid aminotransferase
VAAWVFLNDQFLNEQHANLHFKDLAVQRGYGIFDFFRFKDFKAVFLDDHLDRFYKSAEEMRLNINYSRDQLKDVLHTLITKNNIPDGGIRITVTGGYSPDGFQLNQPNLVISQHTFPSPTKEQFEKGIELISYPHQRQMPHVKSIDYLMAIWLQPLIRQHNADDVLYQKDGIVSECPRSNFFIVTKNNTIITPAENILKGVSRMKLIDIAKKYFQVEEKIITLDDIANAKEAFISSTTKLLLPVFRIDGTILKGETTIAAKLYTELDELSRSS